MLRLTLAQMRRSLPRLVAAGIAIVLGSAFVTATLAAGDAITRGGYDSITARYGSADLVALANQGVLVDAAERVDATPGVRSADPLLVGQTRFESGRRTASQTLVPTPSDPGLGSLEVVDGRAPTAQDEVALPGPTAERLGVGVGDTVTATWTAWREVATSVPSDAAASEGTATSEDTVISEDTATAVSGDVTEQEPVDMTAQVTVVGLVDDPRGAWSGYGGAGLATLADVVRWSGAANLDEVGVAGMAIAVDGDVATVRAALADTLTDATVLTRDEAAERTLKQYTGGGNALMMLVLGFAAVALLVAALVISNTFQVLVAQRTRMLALLRCVGARRSQLRASVMLEATILGIAASLSGVVLGLGLAQGALSLLSRTQDGVPLPTTAHPTLANVLLPILVGTLVTVGAAFVPARAATRVAPVAALRPSDAPSVRARPGRVRLAFSLLLTVGGLVALVGAVLMARNGIGVDGMLPLAVGVLGGAASFVGLLVGAALWIPRVVSAVGRPVARISTSARLAAANTVRNPRRTAATSTALVIGVTLVVMMSTGATSARVSLANEMDERGPIDLVVQGADDVALAPSTFDDLADVAGVAEVVPTRSATVQNADQSVFQAFVVPAGAADLLRDGPAADALSAGRSVAPKRWVDENASTATLIGPSGTGQEIEITPRGSDDVLLTSAAADTLGLADATNAALVRLTPGADAATTMLAVNDLLVEQDVVVSSSAAERQSNEQIIDVTLAVVIGLLGVAVIIALVGVANTLSLSVIERRRESATLRAVGLSRRGLRWMLATEGMLIAGVGALIGTALGLLYGWAGAATVFGTMGDLRLHVPWVHVALVMVVALLAGLAASALPARSAARTPPVAALGVD
jgi:putative ABC transport system permease protein